MKIIKKLGFLVLLPMLFACTQKTSYSSGENLQLASSFSFQDQRVLVNAINEQLRNDKDLINSALSSTRPTIIIDSIVNKTSEHINTQSITDSISASIIREGLFTLVSRQKLDVLAKEKKLNDLGLTSEQRAVQLGKLWGAKYVLYGNFSSIVNYVGRTKQTYYKLSIFIQDVETGAQIWIGEKEIIKNTR